jgi:hypothetical protein
LIPTQAHWRISGTGEIPITFNCEITDEENPMRKTLISVILWCCMTLLSACSAFAPAATATSLPSATPLPSPTITLAPTATSTATALPTATATATATAPLPPTEVLPTSAPTLEVQSTTTTTVDLPLPTGEPLPVWKGIPIMPGAISGAESEGAYTYTIKATPQVVQAFYARELPKAGYSSFAIGTNDTGPVMLMYEKGTQSLLISVIVQGELTLVMILPT